MTSALWPTTEQNPDPLCGGSPNIPCEQSPLLPWPCLTPPNYADGLDHHSSL